MEGSVVVVSGGGVDSVVGEHIGGMLLRLSAVVLGSVLVGSSVKTFSHWGSLAGC